MRHGKWLGKISDDGSYFNTSCHKRSFDAITNLAVSPFSPSVFLVIPMCRPIRMLIHHMCQSFHGAHAHTSTFFSARAQNNADVDMITAQAPSLPWARPEASARANKEQAMAWLQRSVMDVYERTDGTTV